MTPLAFPEWHVRNCKNQVYVYDGIGGVRCTDNLACIHAYAEYRVREANRWRKWPEEKPPKEFRLYLVVMRSKVNVCGYRITTCRFLPNQLCWNNSDEVLMWQPLPEHKEE